MDTRVAAGIAFLGLVGVGLYLIVTSKPQGPLGREYLPGGKGSGRRASDFDPTQLRVGTAIELEHTGDRRIAREIAMDHLTENPRYYTMLCKWEREPACRTL